MQERFLGSMVTHVFPSIWICETQLVMVDSNNWTVLSMQFSVNIMIYAFPSRDMMWNSCKSPDLWAREFTERMEIDSVDAYRDKPTEQLFWVSSSYKGLKSKPRCSLEALTAAKMIVKSCNAETPLRSLAMPVAVSVCGVGDMDGA